MTKDARPRLAFWLGQLVVCCACLARVGEGAVAPTAVTEAVLGPAAAGEPHAWAVRKARAARFRATLETLAASLRVVRPWATANAAAPNAPAIRRQGRATSCGMPYANVTLLCPPTLCSSAPAVAAQAPRARLAEPAFFSFSLFLSPSPSHPTTTTTTHRRRRRLHMRTRLLT